MAYSNLGTLYSMLGEMDKAKKNYNKALIIAPDNANVIYELAMIDKYVDRNRHVKHVERLANDKKTLP
ncbi:MAG: tetratricopeptide repeat protein, partial [Aliifodinibius sp.]|nr:tetratricopeptide repeat protein [Fodinibius sp.]NIV11339.1 tetratricopeptide repeat protein [Fodinibius sp.]NIY24972.1 tetratricopeptide repeat protein [Fodinibius sp.]